METFYVRQNNSEWFVSISTDSDCEIFTIETPSETIEMDSKKFKAFLKMINFFLLQTKTGFAEKD